MAFSSVLLDNVNPRHPTYGTVALRVAVACLAVGQLRFFFRTGPHIFHTLWSILVVATIAVALAVVLAPRPQLAWFRCDF